jgi:MFS family permease
VINRNYSLLLLAYFSSRIGDWLYAIAVPLIVYDITKSAMAMSITYALTFLPFVVVTPFGGILADRARRRTVLIYGDLGAGALVLLLAALVVMWPNTALPIYPWVFVIASISALYHPPFQSIIPSLVDEPRLAEANSYIQTSDNLINLLAPIAAGSVIAILGTLNSLLIDAASFFVSALLVTAIKLEVEEQADAEHPGSITQALKEGFQYAWSNAVIKYGCLLFFISNFAITIYHTNFMYYLVNTLRLTPTQVGITLALEATGALIGSMCALSIGRNFSGGRIILVCTILSGLATFLLLVAGSYWSVGLACGVIEAFDAVIVVTYFTLRQRIIPAEYLGRAVAITRLVSYAAIPIASLMGGWVLHTWGDFNEVVVIGAGTMIAGGCYGWFTPLNNGNAPRFVDVTATESAFGEPSSGHSEPSV